VWLGAVKKDVLLILYIMSITQVTSRGSIVSPGHSLNSFPNQSCNRQAGGVSPRKSWSLRVQ